MRKWEINRVSTPERIFEKINNEMAQPVGIVIFGADYDLKDDVLAELQRGLPDAKVFHGAPSASEMMELIHSSKVGVFMLDGGMSADHQLRHACVKLMHTIGAKSIVGIYVKAQYPQLSSAVKPTQEVSAMMRQINALEQNPPTADGLDYLLIVSEEFETT